MVKSIFITIPFAAIATFIASISAKAPRSIALNIISAVIATCLIFAYVLLFKIDTLIKKARSSSNYEGSFDKMYAVLQRVFAPSFINIAVLHSAAIVIIIGLTVRLSATENFGGHIANLDFGLKANYNGGGENIAFTNSFPTYGHFLQGFFASFLSFPAISGLFSRLFLSLFSQEKLLYRRPRVSTLLLCELLSACMTIYPFYSLVKRLNKESKDFARTSHMNNLTEWIIGYIFGVVQGWLITALLLRNVMIDVGLFENSECIKDEVEVDRVSSVLKIFEYKAEEKIQYRFGASSEYKDQASSTIYSIFRVIHSIFLFLFSITALLTLIFIGITWNYVDENSVQNSNIALTISFVLLWCVVSIFMMYIAKLNQEIH